MPRPKLATEKKKTEAVQLRLNEAERVAFNRLREALAEEMPGVEVTDAGAVRAAVAQAMKIRGIEWPRSTDAATPPEPAAPKKKAAKR